MSQRLPSDAFAFYLSLGAQRSYQAVADHFGVAKQTVTTHATRDKWQEQLTAIEAKAREANERRAIETLEELNEHHMRIWKAVEKRALEGLRSFPMATAMDSVRALDLATKNIRLIRGEPTERTENVEQIVKQQYERWIVKDQPNASAASESKPPDPESSESTDAA